MQFNLDLLNKIMELIEFSMSYKIVEWKKDTHRRMDDLVNAKKVCKLILNQRSPCIGQWAREGVK